MRRKRKETRTDALIGRKGVRTLQCVSCDMLSPVIVGFPPFFLRSSIGGVDNLTIFNSSATWAVTFGLQGYKCMLVMFVFP